MEKLDNIKIVRIGTMANFNCTNKEYDQIPSQVGKNKHFVNTNIKTINKRTAKTVNKRGIKIVITINPEITYIPEYMAKLKLLNKSIVSFIRLKYCAGYNHISLYNTLINMGYNVVITNMRFASTSTFHKYVMPEYRDQYYHKEIVNPKTGKVTRDNYFRLHPDYFPSIFVNVCDRKGKGCQACFLCAKLTFDVIADIASLNLSTSGNCRFNCPDCFAKKCLKQSQGKIAFNKIKMNAKQKGTLKGEK